jgi:nitrite reductase/ring-hydroxylating ferredoxin subunit
VQTGTAVRFDVAGHRLCVVKIEERWYVISDRCSHGDLWVPEIRFLGVSVGRLWWWAAYI